MLLGAGESAVAATATCTDCGAPAGGNFCSACGADLRHSSLAFLGPAVAPVRRSFPIVYLKLLRAPVRQTVAFAEDPTYRSHISFALAGIALYLLVIVPLVLRQVASGGAHVSESMLTLMKVLSQAGVYIGIVIAFLIAFGIFRLFAAEKRPFHLYFKLNCLALGFVAPIYAVYEFVVRNVLGGFGLSSFSGQMTQDDWTRPSTIVSLTMLILMVAYFIGINRRFWRIPTWKATLLYFATYYASSVVSYNLMWWIGWYSAAVLTAAGIVTP